MIVLCNVFWTVYASPVATLISVLISALIAVCLFNRGVKKERRLNAEFRKIEKQDKIDKELQDLAFLKKQLTVLIDGAVKSAKKQGELYTEFTSILKGNPLQHRVPQITEQNHLNRILKLDECKVLRIFQLNKTLESKYVEFYNKIDFLNVVFRRCYYDIHNSNGKKVYDLSNQLITVRQNILNIATEYLSNEKENNTNFQNNQLYVKINEMIFNYYKNYDGVPNLNWDYNKLIIPIKEELLTEKFQYEPIVKDLLKLAKEGGDILFTIKDINTAFIKEFDVVVTRIYKVCESLQEIRDLLVVPK